MANKHRYSAAEVAHALIETKGMVYIAAQRLGCTVETIRLYCKRYPSVQAARDAQRGQMVDLAELKLYQSIQNGEPWGIAFALKTLGKDRGYVERQELTGQDGQGMVLRVVYENAPDPPLALPPPVIDVTTNGYHALDEPAPPEPP
jgi:hypothetical protein